MSSKHRKSRFTGFRAIAALLGAGAVMLAAGAVVISTSGTASAANEGKTAICHRTAADSNPYVFIEVDNSALPAHYNNLPGHPPKYWKSAGTWRGVPHAAGDARNDYAASSAADCQDTNNPPVNEDVAAVFYTATEPTCEADGQLVPATEPDGVIAAQDPAGTGPGTYTITFTADEGFNLTGPSTQTIVVKPMLTGPQCEEESESPSPSEEVSPSEKVSPSEEVSPSEAIEGTETIAPTRTPTVLGTEATVFPTTVHAGLAGQPPTSPGASLLGLSLVGGGLILMTGAGWLAAARRARGEHQV